MNTAVLDRSRLGAGALISLALHLGVGALLGLDPGGSHALAALEERASVQLPPITLGREHSEHETMTWIGYTDPTEHQARLAPVEQAAMSPNPPSPPTPSQHAPPLTKPTTEAMRAEMVEQARAAAQVVEEAGRMFDASVARTLEMLKQLAAQTVSARESENPAKAEADASLAQHPNAEPQQTPTKSRGNAQEQESEGTSTTEPTKIQMGKPATAQGLFIRTVRPTYGLVTRATARPADPVLKVEFLRDGSVDQVHVERSSGNERVDQAIIDAVFMWTAEGERLGKLGESETTSIRIRISL